MNSLLNLNSLLSNFNWLSNRINMTKKWTLSIPFSPVTPSPHTMCPRSINSNSCDIHCISFSHILYQIHPPPTGFICSPSSPPSPPALPGLWSQPLTWPLLPGWPSCRLSSTLQWDRAFQNGRQIMSLHLISPRGKMEIPLIYGYPTTFLTSSLTLLHLSQSP